MLSRLVFPIDVWLSFKLFEILTYRDTHRLLEGTTKVTWRDADLARKLLDTATDKRLSIAGPQQDQCAHNDRLALA